jgi:hypothetical protein
MTCDIIQLTPSTFGHALANTCNPGDLVLYDYGKKNIISWFIERCQRRMLADYSVSLVSSVKGQLPRLVIERAAAFVHAGMWLNQIKSAEMTRPAARFIRWPDRLTPGDNILIRRPANRDERTRALIPVDRETGERAANAMSRIARAKLDYPESEIFRFYGWSWGLQKLTFGRRFAAVFDNETSDVCSDSCWGCYIEAEAWPGISQTAANPAGYYPARLAMSSRFITIARVQIVAGSNQAKETTK